MTHKFIVVITLLFSLSQGAWNVAFAQDKSVYDFEFKTIDGDAMPMSQFAGKVVLLVNTASKCGYTPQYEGLQTLWTAYKNKGLVVVGVPSNDFRQQEPGTSAEIKEFCEINYGVDFPLAEKNKVIGKSAHPLYVWLKKKLGSESRPKWNFHKYLIDSKGKPVAFFPTKVKPMAPEVLAKIDAELLKG